MWVKGQITHNLESASLVSRAGLSRDEQSSLFDRMSWFRLLWAHNVIGHQPIIVRALADRVHCWLFLADKGRGQVTALANYYTLAFRPIFSGDPDETHKLLLLIAMARRLKKDIKAVSQITLTPVPEADGTADLLASAFRGAGWIVTQDVTTYNWTLSCAGMSFEAYWAKRPGTLRSTFERKAKKAKLDVEIHHTLTDELWSEYETVYAASWKPEEGSLPFLRALAEQESAAGCLRLGFARRGGVAVAAQLWTVETGHAIIHKLAYREDEAENSPGTILTAALFQHVMDEDRVSLIDYGTGDDAYKADWMDTRNPMCTLTCYRLASIKGLTKAVMTRLAGRK